MKFIRNIKFTLASFLLIVIPNSVYQLGILIGIPNSPAKPKSLGISELGCGDNGDGIFDDRVNINVELKLIQLNVFSNYLTSI